MSVLISFWRLRLQALKNSGLSREKNHRLARTAFWGGVAVAFWLAVFLIFYRILKYFQQAEILGDILAMKLLYMIVITCFGILILSNLITGLTKFYLARDLNLVYSLPLSARDIFTARGWEVAFDSSWMVLLFGFPVFLSYGIVYEATILFYLITPIAMIILCLLASALSAVIILTAGALIPAGRLKAGLSLVTVLIVVSVVVAVRLLRPEQLVNPDQFANVAYYVSALKVSSPPFLPTSWVYDAIRLSLKGGRGVNVFHNLALGTAGAASLFYLGGWLADKYLVRGFTLGEMVKTRTPAGRITDIWPQKMPYVPSDVVAFFVKEIKTFLRDQTQWPQLILIVVLIGIYLYNFSVLPLDKTPIQTVYLQNVFSFLNIALTSFVLTAIAARFVFPALSIEGRSFWIVLSAPTDLERVLWIKFFFYLIPLLFFSELLIVCSNLLLGVTPLMMLISTGTVLMVVPMIIALALVFGAVYPSFHNENPMEAVTSFGGILYMIVSTLLVAFIIILEAGPVYQLFMSRVRGEPVSGIQILWMIGTFALVIFISFFTVSFSLKEGKRRLMAMN